MLTFRYVFLRVEYVLYADELWMSFVVYYSTLSWPGFRIQNHNCAKHQVYNFGRAYPMRLGRVEKPGSRGFWRCRWQPYLMLDAVV